jgi:hypothetical protein
MKKKPAPAAPRPRGRPTLYAAPYRTSLLMTAEDGADLATFRRWLSLRDGKDYTIAAVLLGALKESAPWKAWKREEK